MPLVFRLPKSVLLKINPGFEAFVRFKLVKKLHLLKLTVELTLNEATFEQHCQSLEKSQ